MSCGVSVDLCPDPCVAVAVVQAGSCSSHLTPSLGTSICYGCSPKKTRQKERKTERKEGRKRERERQTERKKERKKERNKERLKSQYLQVRRSSMIIIM